MEIDTRLVQYGQVQFKETYVYYGAIKRPRPRPAAAVVETQLLRAKALQPFCS